MNKLGLNVALGALVIAGGGLYYHYFVYTPRIDQQMIKAAADLEREKWKFDAEERREIAAREKLELTELTRKRNATYESCLSDARLFYAATWNKACSDDAKDTLIALQNCLPPSDSSESYLLSKIVECNQRFNLSTTDEKPNCKLRPSLAEPINQQFLAHKSTCLAELSATL